MFYSLKRQIVFIVFPYLTILIVHLGHELWVLGGTKVLGNKIKNGINFKNFILKGSLIFCLNKVNLNVS